MTGMCIIIMIITRTKSHACQPSRQDLHMNALSGQGVAAAEVEVGLSGAVFSELRA
jgi:hypothetical protein